MRRIHILEAIWALGTDAAGRPIASLGTHIEQPVQTLAKTPHESRPYISPLLRGRGLAVE
jgi:hypothetical protein